MSSTRLKIIMDAVNNTEREFKKIRKDLGGIANLAKTAFALVGANILIQQAQAITQWMANIVHETVKANTEILLFTEQIGGTTQQLSEMEHVAGQVGIKLTQLTTGLQRQVRRISEAASGMGEAKKAIEELGLDPVALERLAPVEQFFVLAEALNQVENQSDRVRLAFKLWDSEGVRFLRMVQQGTDGMIKQMNVARSLGITLDQETAENMRRLGEVINEIAALFQNTLAAAVQNSSTDLLDMAETIRDFLVPSAKVAIEVFKEWQTILQVFGEVFEVYLMRNFREFWAMFTVISPHMSLLATDFAKRWINAAVEIRKEMNDLREDFQQDMEGMQAVVVAVTAGIREEAVDAANAAREAFERFLIEPTKEGFRDLLKEWLRILQQMFVQEIAEQAFARAGVANLVNSLFNSAFGAPTVNPGKRGSSPAPGGSTFIINVDARGSEPGVEARINEGLTKARNEIFRELELGRVAVRGV